MRNIGGLAFIFIPHPNMYGIGPFLKRGKIEVMIELGIYQYIPNDKLMFINKVCEAFKKAKIPYAVVGGYAVALYGVPRATFDIDFVIDWSLENLKKTEEELKKLGLVSRIPVDAESVFSFRDEYIQNRNLIAWGFYDPGKPIHEVDILINYDLKNANTKTVRTALGNIIILSKKDLIAMKKTSGRPQDLEDVKSLEQL